MDVSVVQLLLAGEVARLCCHGADCRQPLVHLPRPTPMPPCRDVDMALSELAAAVPVDIMPGAGDPANYTLPQQPLHRCLFPGAAAYSSLHRATNPHDFEVDGVTFLGTSGQNVDDVYR